MRPGDPPFPGRRFPGLFGGPDQRRLPPEGRKSMNLSVRKARMGDIRAIHALLMTSSADGLLLPRSLTDLHLRSTAAMPGGNFIESSHLAGRGHIIDLIRIFEKENPGLPMRIDHGRMMLGDEDKGYNPGYSFYGRMLALAQVEGMMTVVDDEIKRQMKL